MANVAEQETDGVDTPLRKRIQFTKSARAILDILTTKDLADEEATAEGRVATRKGAVKKSGVLSEEDRKSEARKKDGKILSDIIEAHYRNLQNEERFNAMLARLEAKIIQMTALAEFWQGQAEESDRKFNLVSAFIGDFCRAAKENGQLPDEFEPPELDDIAGFSRARIAVEDTVIGWEAKYGEDNDGLPVNQVIGG